MLQKKMTAICYGVKAYYSTAVITFFMDANHSFFFNIPTGMQAGVGISHQAIAPLYSN